MLPITEGKRFSKRLGFFAFRGLATVLLSLFLSFSAQAKDLTVLVVMSYEQDNPWCREIKEGIDSVLAPVSELTYVYMDTKVNFQGGPKKAEEAFALYKSLRPDGVITVDDNAQSMFVVPFLKDKVTTPVMFSGVNADAEKYGYPSKNVSGILERGHIRESIAFARQLSPAIRTVCFVMKESPSGHALSRQVETERESYSAKVAGIHMVRNTTELTKLGQKISGSCDAVFMDSLEGIRDKNDRPLANRALFEIFFKAYGGPVIGANRYHVEEGAFSAVVKTGQEQGGTAAEMLLKAMQGTPVDQIPITRNVRGRRIINVETMDTLKITPRPIDLRGATLVKTKR